ncbi:hypothetical protein Y032_0032g2519 [Ancylostoma ceylanicum]|uniref:Uncharacterized protein n=1 Tax=Ancylostoma ceylanicum TaxID=53326 RepID=A0A016UPM8_9BILA|nr:hypothetical protein Y032_0032g2519 [Ancylostoma ceylanicum]
MRRRSKIKYWTNFYGFSVCIDWNGKNETPAKSSWDDIAYHSCSAHNLGNFNGCRLPSPADLNGVVRSQGIERNKKEMNAKLEKTT